MNAHDKIKAIHKMVGDMARFGEENTTTSGTDAERRVLLDLGILAFGMVKVLNKHIDSIAAEDATDQAEATE